MTQKILKLLENLEELVEVFVEKGSRESIFQGIETRMKRKVPPNDGQTK